FHVRPVRALFREDADMAKRREATEIVEAVMLHRPGFAERFAWKPPAAHAFFIGVTGEDRVGLGPFALRQGGLPDGLPLGALDPVRAVLLKLASVARIQKGVVGVGLYLEDQR